MPNLEKIIWERYPMCKDQVAQLDCRRENCIFQNNGNCNNISPAITLNEKTYVCWSFKEIIEDET